MNFWCLISFLLVSKQLFSQQLPQFTQFSNNNSLVNNANFINDSNGLEIGARSQMLGFGLEPNSAFIYGKYGIKKKPVSTYNPQFRISRPIPDLQVKPKRFNQAVAVIALIDRYGAFERSHFSGVYVLGSNINSNWRLSGSFKLGVSNLGFNQEDAVVLNSNDPFANYINGDLEYDGFVSGSSRATTVDLGTSVFVSSKLFKLGFSLDQLAGNTLRFSNGSIYFNQKVHYNVLIGYSFPISKKIVLETMGVIKQMNPAPISFDLTARTVFPSGFWAGFNYRNQSSLGIMVGCKIGKKLKIGYSYDLITTRLNLFSSGGHEIILGYAF
jgi:type IX secretion system PorP/SprF family membrane protein